VIAPRFGERLAKYRQRATIMLSQNMRDRRMREIDQLAHLPTVSDWAVF